MSNGPFRSWYRVAIMAWLFFGMCWWAGCLDVTLQRARNGLEDGAKRKVIIAIINDDIHLPLLYTVKPSVRWMPLFTPLEQHFINIQHLY